MEKEVYSGRLKGFPHPDGVYTGYYLVDENGLSTWYMVDIGDGYNIEVEDSPQIMITIPDNGPVHDERCVFGTTGAILYACSDIPKYWINYLAKEKDGPIG